MKQFREKMLGDAAFYRMVLLIAVPIMIQNGITNFVSLLDNVMVGQLGTEEMSGVAVVNQLIFVFNLCMFGLVSGASIFSAQFYGQNNQEGVRQTFRFKMLVCILVTVLWLIVLGASGSSLVNLYLSEDGSGSLAATYEAGMAYLGVIMIGLLPTAISQCYASTLRETGETLLPMIASSLAVAVNLAGNYILIFGNFGAPRLGVTGAAAATVASRFVELGILVVWTHSHGQRAAFIQGAYTSFRISPALVRQILIKGTPLFVNETLWSAGQAALVQCYSTLGLSAVAAFNISSTISQLFNVVFLALGSAIGIVVGQQLGAGEVEKAVDTDRKMIVFAVAVCVVVGAVMFAASPVIPRIYNTSGEVRQLSTRLIQIGACFMPLYSFYNAAYFTLRSGGKTIITFLFDSVYVLAISYPVAMLLVHFTALPLVKVYLLVQSAEILKAIVGYILVKKRVWVNNIVAEI